MPAMQIPSVFAPLFEPARFKVFYGGRGSAKSVSFARALLTIASNKKTKILCGREFQNSISDSVHSLLKEQAQVIGLSHLFKFTNTSITGINGSEFIFKGLRHNIESIKSIPDIDILWIEEGDSTSKSSLNVIIPTIRKEDSEIWISYNPKNEDDPVYEKFVKNSPPPDSIVKKVNWYDNPFFPKVLKREMEHDYEIDPELAEHVWGGECRSHSDAQIFKGKWKVKAFEIDPSWDGPYFGADWGFSVDPTTIVKLYLDMKNSRIMVRNSKGGPKIDMPDIPKLFDQIPESRNFKIRGDNSRPETISYVAQKGFNIEAALKWPGSVEDGIEWLKGFTFVVHPECSGYANELKNYCYKVDRLTGDVTNKIVDLHNHYMDATRYALQPMIKSKTSILDNL